MFKIILLLLFFISTVIVKLLSILHPINDQTSGEIFNRLPVYFTPAYYVFYIWIFIVISLAWWIWNMMKDYKSSRPIPTKRILLYGIASILYILFIFSWHYEQFGYAFATISILLGCLFILYLTYPLDDRNRKNRLPISLLLGWTFISFFTNLSYLLTFYEFGGFGITKSLWGVIFLTFATAIALHFRYHYFDRLMSIVFIWTFIGVAIHHNINQLLLTTASLFLSCVLIVGIFFLNKTPSKK
ncbi:tryptophan-rich sensory protein [Psychrobacillus antarcticus]|uniref:tryptophan-rich sensory protein n=1 Tax=Psychrobacillus antarcticus TaxID=2879115 RepID=UPI002407DC2E|nr:tryptophan-rich sensory protein [Psychrobacillus antarcticus]